MTRIRILIHEFATFYGLKAGYPVLVREHSAMTSYNLERLLDRSFGSSWLMVGSCNTVLIEGEDRIIVDPGAPEVGLQQVLGQRLKELDLRPSDIDLVINTHLHADHAGSNFLFRGKKLIVHEKEVESSNLSQMWPEFFDACLRTMKIQPVSGDTEVSDDVSIVTTPGHTIGSISVVVKTPTGSVVIAGDAVSSADEYRKRKTPDSAEDKQAYLSSLDRIRALNPRTIIPGHDIAFSTTPAVSDEF